MQDCITKASAAAISISLLTTVPAATPFVFSTGSVTNQIATASRPGPAWRQPGDRVGGRLHPRQWAYLQTEGTRPCA